MRIVAGLLMMLLVAAGCSNKDKVPSGIIPRVEMEKILWDMIQADQYSSLYLLKDSARIDVKTETLKLYQEVFRLHQVSRDEFRKSFQYYQEHPELTRSVFDSLLARGNRLRADSYSRPSLTPFRSPVTAPAIPPPGAPVPALSKPPAGVSKPITASRPPVSASKPPMTAPGLAPGSPVTMPKHPVIAPGNPVVLPKSPKADTAKGKQPK
jgi:hypothetical protein